MLDNIRNMDDSTENEVFAAYQQVLLRLKDTQKISKQEEKIIEEKKQVVEAAVKESEETIAQQIASLKSALSKSLDDIEDKLLAEQKQISTLQQAIDHQHQEIQDLYNIKANANTLALILQAHKEKCAEFEEEMTKKKYRWAKEQEEVENARKERDLKLKRERQREEEEYIYQRDLQRKKERDQYESVKLKQEQELLEKRNTLEEELKKREAEIIAREKEFQQYYETTTRTTEEKFKEREAKLAAREQELAQLNDKVNHFPQELQKAIADTEKLVTEKLRIQHEYEIKLNEKDFEAERKLFKQEIEAMQVRIDHLESLNYSFVKPLAYSSINVNEDTKEKEK